MAGYDWNNGKSNNAVIAENEGKFPISKVKKSTLEEYGVSISLVDAKLLAKHGYWKACEWHHTSKHFNTTYYYDLYDLKSLVEDAEYKEIISKIKTKQQTDKIEDIIYAKIEVTEFYKSRGRWIPETITLLAEVNNYNGMGEYCTYNGNRKKKSNIDILYKMTFEEYKSQIEDIKREQEKFLKKERLTQLRSFKKDILTKYAALLKKHSNNEQLSTLIQKIKNAKTIKGIRNAELTIKKITDELQDKIIQELRDTCVDGINLSDWILLPHEARHPAPKSVMDIKRISGLSWNAFERKLRGATNE